MDEEILYPYYTPREMIKLGVYNENVKNNYYHVMASVDNTDWFCKYNDFNDSGDWYNKMVKVYTEYMKYPDEKNKQSVLELGWNPELNFFDKKIVEMASIATKKRLENERWL